MMKLRFIIPFCIKIEGYIKLNYISLSKTDLSDLQKRKGLCDCCIFSKKSNL
ncbi:a13621bd-8408-484f-8be7-836143d7bdfa-CDS [Sclerotinia trifoliorum]|uniref:A13621bd-8408-484f-8be7-836143d7bdfa-CDS n=1 Tax=Sclerotinia trifoliorum TaxID=28548 RepID=A0A8H2VXJ5_9HELO|nr:a13621bd-8408-484f-8be7-836143d7bdfa-CDS [Sclerotinia trifoliorum]